MSSEAFITMRPEFSQFASETRSGLGRMAGIAKVGGAAIAAAAVAAGTAAFRIGEQFHDASNTIRFGTGATGQALDGLKDDFRAVVADVPASFGDASTAIADINTRLGLTGEPLQKLSGQFLDLARVTGGDVANQVALGARVFGDWDVATESQAETLDKLFRGAQASGIGVDQLMGKVVQFGSPLRAMGFGLEESAAMFAKFEQEGVNAELVIGSLRQGLGQMARAGEDAPETFRRVVEEIEGMESRTEATAAAMELFGARAGPDMAAAIQEGRFELGDMLAMIEGGSDTIGAAASDTEGFSESWQRFKNRAMLALEPIATRVFDMLTVGMEWLADAWDTHGEAVTAGVVRFGEIVSSVFATVGGWVDTVVGWFESLSTDVVGSQSELLADIMPLWESVREVFASAMEAIQAIVSAATSAVEWIWGRFGDNIVAFLRTAWDNAMQVIGGALNVIQGIFEVFAGLFTGDWSRMWDGVRQILSGAWNVIVGLVRQALNVLRTVFTIALSALSSLWSAAWSGIGRALSAAWSAIVSGVRTRIAEVVAFFRGLPARIRGALSNAGSMLLSVGRDIIRGMVRGITSMARAPIDAVRNIGSSIVSGAKGLLGIGSPSRVFMEIGEDTTEGLALGLAKDAEKVSRTMLDMLEVPNVNIPRSGLSPLTSVASLDMPSGRDPVSARLDRIAMLLERGQVIEMDGDRVGRSLRRGLHAHGV